MEWSICSRPCGTSCTNAAASDVQFLLMGAGPEYDTLSGAATPGICRNWVAMPGRVTDQFLFTALQTMDLGVACDPSNGYNDHCTMNKTLEYMAFGKPQVMFETPEGRISAGESARYVVGKSRCALGDAILDRLDDEQADCHGSDRAPAAWKGS